jgi:hypothetical protein
MSWRRIELMLFSLVGSSRRILVRYGQWLKNWELKYMMHTRVGYSKEEVGKESATYDVEVLSNL